MTGVSLHQKLENNTGLLIFGILFVSSIGGLVQVLPSLFQESLQTPTENTRVYTPLELIGRDIYIREGCYVCHSQMVRPFRAETERYGHYSLAGEYVYDRPFQWGSKRTGPDLARVGGRYSDEWHVQHLEDPQSVVPESIMPKYSFLGDTPLNTDNAAAMLVALRRVGVPYSDRDVGEAMADMILQADPDSGGDVEDFQQRYPKA